MYFYVVICLKIRTFVVSATTRDHLTPTRRGCDLLENSYLCGISNNFELSKSSEKPLWFAWKFVPLWYQQQHERTWYYVWFSCDLLENSYLCGISNNYIERISLMILVVICLKIRTFVVSATTFLTFQYSTLQLWFAWKFVPLWYQQQQLFDSCFHQCSCDLLENSYLCGISNNMLSFSRFTIFVVICLKIRTFVVSATTKIEVRCTCLCCDLLENSYLCGISNNTLLMNLRASFVVICLKIRTFVVSATTL